ncbi:hypothetical protein J517_2046 [Acinetobacter baumannii 118362]|nr:hypothetical protein J517_2046 [Acinetobacter baumannii 118362]
MEKITLIFKQGLFKQNKPLLFWRVQTICLQNKPINHMPISNLIHNN